MFRTFRDLEEGSRGRFSCDRHLRLTVIWPCFWPWPCRHSRWWTLIVMVSSLKMIWVPSFSRLVRTPMTFHDILMMTLNDLITWLTYSVDLWFDLLLNDLWLTFQLGLCRFTFIFLQMFSYFSFLCLIFSDIFHSCICLVLFTIAVCSNIK